MGIDREFFAEEKIGKVTDVRLMKRIYPFARPYWLYLAVAVVLILAVTLIDLAMPYVTKIAIDRYIVPAPGVASSRLSGSDGHNHFKERFIEVDISDPAVQAVVAKYRDRFEVSNNRTVIRWTDLAGIQKADIVILRKHD
ncbi:MAG: ABC transporter ATP-binding protein, partial [Thermodesulfobacteriota bacterium]|nr:ABC transporter ATP-binding protein [Thermodesulfobacteriota bacterium]